MAGMDRPIDPVPWEGLEFPTPSLLQSMPPKVLRRICAYLSPESTDLLQLALTCRDLKQLSLEYLWRCPRFRQPQNFHQFLTSVHRYRDTAARIRCLRIMVTPAHEFRVMGNRSTTTVILDPSQLLAHPALAQHPCHRQVQNSILADPHIIITLVRLCENLRELAIYGWKIRDQHLLTLASLCSRLRRFELVGGSHYSIQSLVQTVYRMPRLEALTLDTNISITPELAKLCATKQIQLTTLKLAGAGVTSDALAPILASSSELACLAVAPLLDFTDTQLHQWTSSHLNLQSITLADTAVDARTLCHLLEHCAHLRHLDIRRAAKFGPDTAVPEWMVPISASLQVLIVDNLLMTDDLALMIASNCRSLELLGIRGCEQFTDEGVAHFAQNLTNLIGITLVQCLQVTENALGTLADHQHEALLYVVLEQCKVHSSSAVEQFTQSCPRLKFLAVKGVETIQQAFAYQFSSPQGAQAARRSPAVSSPPAIQRLFSPLYEPSHPLYSALTENQAVKALAPSEGNGQSASYSAQESSNRWVQYFNQLPKAPEPTCRAQPPSAHRMPNEIGWTPANLDKHPHPSSALHLHHASPVHRSLSRDSVVMPQPATLCAHGSAQSDFDGEANFTTKQAKSGNSDRTIKGRFVERPMQPRETNADALMYQMPPNVHVAPSGYTQHPPLSRVPSTLSQASSSLHQFPPYLSAGISPVLAYNHLPGPTGPALVAVPPPAQGPVRDGPALPINGNRSLAETAGAPPSTQPKESVTDLINKLAAVRQASKHSQPSKSTPSPSEPSSTPGRPDSAVATPSDTLWVGSELPKPFYPRSARPKSNQGISPSTSVISPASAAPGTDPAAKTSPQSNASPSPASVPFPHLKPQSDLPNTPTNSLKRGTMGATPSPHPSTGTMGTGMSPPVFNPPVDSQLATRASPSAVVPGALLNRPSKAIPIRAPIQQDKASDETTARHNAFKTGPGDSTEHVTNGVTHLNSTGKGTVAPVSPMLPSKPSLAQTRKDPIDLKSARSASPIHPTAAQGTTNGLAKAAQPLKRQSATDFRTAESTVGPAAKQPPSTSTETSKKRSKNAQGEACDIALPSPTLSQNGADGFVYPPYQQELLSTKVNGKDNTTRSAKLSDTANDFSRGSSASRTRETTSRRQRNRSKRKTAECKPSGDSRFSVSSGSSAPASPKKAISTMPRVANFVAIPIPTFPVDKLASSMTPSGEPLATVPKPADALMEPILPGKNEPKPKLALQPANGDTEPTAGPLAGAKGAPKTLVQPVNGVATEERAGNAAKENSVPPDQPSSTTNEAKKTSKACKRRSTRVMVPGRGKLILDLNIETKAGTRESLMVYEHDDTRQAARNFCQRHEMGDLEDGLVRLIEDGRAKKMAKRGKAKSNSVSSTTSVQSALAASVAGESGAGPRVHHGKASNGSGNPSSVVV
ncbi:Nonsense-mediated mRNA decay protein 5 [Dimargaris verticillata]|uniref:Nonsense-mediated mRNA decay protein 5 n=1 Tax=Dimargaris verticillata TaxID=2761393 RepID=A0A9W8B597_9FUNG|nr:Nonsense-mediated mRNA decay protein 5 [Dimargaris verticillata]